MHVIKLHESMYIESNPRLASRSDLPLDHEVGEQQLTSLLSFVLTPDPISKLFALSSDIHESNPFL